MGQFIEKTFVPALSRALLTSSKTAPVAVGGVSNCVITRKSWRVVECSLQNPNCCVRMKSARKGEIQACRSEASQTLSQ